MMKDVIIKIDQNSMVYKQETVLGISYENLQGKIIFKFLGTFPKGIAYLEYERGTEKGYIQMNQVGEEYQLEIKSSLLTKEGRIYLQLRVTEDATPEGTPVFKSNKFYLEVKEAINATAEIPDEYPEWIDTANEKIKEMDNLNITTERVEDGVDIILTDKKGVTTRTEVKDGVPGPVGPQGAPGAVKMQVVDTLPETGETDTIYLVKKDNPGEQNLYDEYVYTDTGWEHIGDTSVDLTDYYTKEESDKNLNDTISENMPLFINAPKYADFVGEKTTEIFRKWYNNYKNGKYIPIMLYTYSRTDWKYVYCFLTGIHDDGTSRLYLYFTNMKVNSSNEIIPSTISYATTFIVYSGTPDKSFVAINANNDNGSLPFKQITNITNSTISNYTLTKTNTTAYTPTKEYHPATKLYVDDNVKTYTAGDNIKISEDNVISATINNTENIPIYKLKLSVYSTLEWETLSFIEGDDATRLKEILTDVKNKQLSLFYIDVSDYNDQYHTLLTPGNTIVFGSSPTSSLDFKGLCLQNRQIGVDQSTPLSGIQISINGINWGGDSVTFNSAMFLLTPNHFIPIDNTTVYAPTADYHPSTKKYVDDVITDNISRFIPCYSLLSTDNLKLQYFSDNAKELKSTYTEIGNAINDAYTKGYKKLMLHFYTNDDSNGYNNITFTSMNVDLQNQPTEIRYQDVLMNTEFVSTYFQSLRLDIYGTWSDNIFTVNSALLRGRTNKFPSQNEVLTKTNTTSYTPTGDYNPATKKYVDDQVGNINTVLATLTTVSEVTK